MIPDFPVISYELEWRNINDISIQQEILTEIERLIWTDNPMILFEFKCLSTYIAIRPAELLNIRERNIDLRLSGIIIPHPKEKRPKIVYLLSKDIEFIQMQPRGLPNLYFFRHVTPARGRTVGSRWCKNYFSSIWHQACKNIGVEGVDMYGGTRHRTATYMGQTLTPEGVKTVTGHTSKAGERYFQNQQSRALKITKKV